MRVNSLMIVAGCCFLSACATQNSGYNEAITYDLKTMHNVKMAEDTYQVYEHPNRDRILTTPSAGKSFGSGFVQGLTLGVVKVRPSNEQLQAAAMQYLKETGRENCTITSNSELVTLVFEYKFTCPDATIAPKS